jgi:hypothetical protein
MQIGNADGCRRADVRLLSAVRPLIEPAALHGVPDGIPEAILESRTDHRQPYQATMVSRATDPHLRTTTTRHAVRSDQTKTPDEYNRTMSQHGRFTSEGGAGFVVCWETDRRSRSDAYR